MKSFAEKFEKAGSEYVRLKVTACNFISIEHDIPHGIAKGIMEQAIIIVPLAAELRMQGDRLESSSVLQAFERGWMAVAREMGLPDARMQAAIITACKRTLAIVDAVVGEVKP